jgi:hypothetical protein
VNKNQLFVGNRSGFRIGDAVKSTTTVSKRGGSWHIGTIGDAYLAKIISAVPENQPKLKIISIEELLPRLSDYAKDFDKQYGEQLRNKRLVNERVPSLVEN